VTTTLTGALKTVRLVKTDEHSPHCKEFALQ
jgi:hypothetical protein